MKNTSKILAAAALTILAATGVQAEEYQGVHALTQGRDRAEVAAEAVQAARAGNVYGDAAGAFVTAPLVASAPRSEVVAEAVAAAHNPFQSMDRKAFYRDTLPASYTGATILR